MKTEDLKAQGLTDEQVNFVMAEYGKDTIALKTKIATLEDDLKVQKGVVEEKNNKIKEFENQDIEAIKKAEYEKGKAEGNAEIEKFKFNNALDNALKVAKVKDGKTISGLLDMSKIKLENEKIVGLEEQLQSLMESHDYLFDSDKPLPKFSDKTPGLNNTSTDEVGVAEMKRIMGLKEQKQGGKINE